MNRPRKFLTSVVSLFLLYPAIAPSAADENTEGSRTVTLLFTNDVESAYDPIAAFWIDGMARIGGIAEMTTLIRELRETEPNVFLFDSGDIFTGALAKLTQGQLAFELMITMGYDAMAIGNHEFEYGHEIFAWAKKRAPMQTDAESDPRLQRNGVPIKNGDRFSVAAPGFLAEGGDLYDSFREADVLRNTDKVSDIMVDYFSKRDIVAVPDRGRQIDVMREQ